jgi:hypothetical protein
MPDLSLNSRTMRTTLALLAIVLTMVASACSDQVGYERPGTWRPTGANDYNLRVMVANPRDLDAGASASTDRGNGASRAVTRLLIDRRRPLLNVSSSRVVLNNTEPDSPLPSAGSAAGGPATQSAPAAQ